MKNVTFKMIPAVEFGSLRFTNPKNAAKECALVMLRREKRIREQHDSINMYSTDPLKHEKWDAYRKRSNSYVKRAKRRLTPIFVKAMS